LQTAPGERAVVNIEISVTIFKLHLLGVAGNPDGKDTGSMQDFLRDIGAEPAKDLLSLALMLQNLSGLGEDIVNFSKAVKYIHFDTTYLLVYATV